MQGNTSYNGNSSLKGINTKIDWTQEMVEEYVKCSEDPIYFIDNYVKIITLDKGLQPFKLYDYQKRYIKELHENRFVVSMQARQSGKCGLFSTLINIRNRSSNEEYRLPIGEFHKFTKDNTYDISKYKIN